MSGENAGATVPTAPPGTPLMVAGSTVALLVSKGAAETAAPMVSVPDVVGQKQALALEALQAAGFAVEVLKNPNPSFPAGVVSHQLPIAGGALPRGARVCIIASTGPVQAGTPHVVLPDTVGKPAEEAVTILQQAGLAASVIDAVNPAVAQGVVFAQEPNARSLGRQPEKKSKAWLWLALLAVVMLAVAFALYFFGGGKPVDVPDVTGLTLEAAQVKLEEADLVLGKVTEEQTESVEPGLVITSDPAAGESVESGSRVDVVVAVGLAGVEVPNVVGESLDDARGALEEAGLTVRVEEVFSDKADQGEVVAQSPQAGARVQEGTEVALSVSKGAEPAANVKVPDLSGMTEDEAKAALEKVGLDYKDLLAYSDTVPKDEVAGQSPAAGASVAPGTQVAFLISKGPAPSGVTEVSVPNVTGMTKDDAENALADVGLKTEELEWTSETVAEDVVIAQLPAAGQMEPEGSTVLIIVSTGPAPAQ